MRYVIRKEFYGALCYDRMTATCIALDHDSYSILKAFKNDRQVDRDVLEFLSKEEFILNGEPNYKLVENSFEGETLSSPTRIHFYYTNRCNLNCKHCFSKQSDNTKPELTFAEKIKMLDEMVELGIHEILIGGGEPFVDPTFFDFVEECLKRQIETKVFTNGLLLSEKIINRIANWELKYLSISVDGVNDDEYKSLRGVDGISILKRNIQKLKKKCKYPVAISITVNSINYNSASEYLALMKDIGIDRLKVRPVKPSGNVYSNPTIYLSDEQYVHFLQEVYKEWNSKYSNLFKIDCSWGDARLVFNKKKMVLDVLNYPFPYEGYGCFAGKASLVIDANGYALPCGFLPSSMQRNEVDRINNKSIKEIWDTGPKLKALRNIPANKVCLKCNYYGVCRGGCIARILFDKRRINEVDPWCLAKWFPLKIDK